MAIQDCELFRLSRRDFQNAIDPFPEVYDKISKIALERYESTMKIEEEESNMKL